MKKLTAIVILLFISSAAFAQEIYNSSGNRAHSGRQHQKKGFDPQRLIFGGGLGLSFGDVTNISISPIIGYRITDKFSAGIGLGYDYYRAKNFYAIPDIYGNYSYYDYKTNIFSASVWARYVVFRNFFVQGEYEHNFMSFTDYGYDPNGSGSIIPFNDHISVPSVLLGGGFRQPVSEHSSFVIMALYDVLQKEYSPYKNRVDIRVGFNAGF